MKSVLFTNHHIKEYAGSELVILDLAKHFQLLGWEVDIATFETGEPVLTQFRSNGIDVFDLLNNPILKKQYDLIWAQHHPVITEYLSEEVNHCDKIVLSCLSPYEPLETPPVFSNQVSLVLANSKETRDELLRCGVEKKRIMVFPNSLPSKWFINNVTEKKKQDLKRIAVVSNHPPIELLDFGDMSHTRNLEICFIGLHHRYELVTPELLGSFDAVIAIGRTVQQAMALKIPVYCYDHFGGPGWLTEANYNKAEYYNFSGRCCRRRINEDQIINEVINGFAVALNFPPKAFELCMSRYSLEKNVEIVLEEISNSPISLKPSCIHQIKRINQTYIRCLRDQKNNQKINLELFWLKENTFSENNSIREPIIADGYMHQYSITLPPFEGLLRLDPGNRPAYIEIKSIRLYDASSKKAELLYCCSVENHFDGLVAGNGVIKLGSEEDVCRFICTEEDPQIFLQNIPSLCNRKVVLRIAILISLSLTDVLSKEILDLQQSISKVSNQLESQTAEIDSLNIDLSRNNKYLEEKNNELAYITKELDRLNSNLEEKDNKLVNIKKEINILNNNLDEKNNKLASITKELACINNNLDDKNKQLKYQSKLIGELKETVKEKDEAMNVILKSKSWRVTAPLRWVGDILDSISNFLKKYN